MKRIALGSALVGVLLLLSALWLMNREPDSTRASGSSPVVAPVADKPTDLARPAEVANVPAEHGGTVTSERTTIAPDASDAAKTLTVSVVDDDSGAPVDGAVVHLIDRERVDTEALMLFVQSSTDTLAPYEKFGVAAHTPSSGRARVPWSGGEASVLATLGERLVAATVPKDGPDELELRMPRASAVTARVVDRSGRPVAGVPVALHLRVDGPMSFAFDLRVQPTEAPDGVTRFHGFRDLIQVSDEEAKVEHFVRLALPGADQEPRAFDIDDPPDAPIELRLGVTAPVEVRVVDESGELVDVAASVTLHSPDEPGRDRPKLAAALEAGVARFPFVGREPALEAVVTAPERGAEWKGRLAGPRAEGELAVLEVVAPTRPVLVARLVRDDGSPYVADKAGVWRMVVQVDMRRRLSRLVVPDDDARIRFEINEPLAVGDTVEVKIEHLAGPGPDAEARPEAPLVVQAGRNQLGDLVVRGVAGVIAGRCIDLDGEPVRGVRIGAMMTSGIGFVDDTDQRGRFSLRGIFVTPAVLDVESEDWVAVEPVVVTPGDEDVVVRLARGGSIRATLAPDGSNANGRTSMVVYDASLVDPGGTDWSAYPSFDEDGVALAQGLPSGRYRCVVYDNGMALVEVDDVVVTLGQQTVDPRLQALDLTSLTRTIQLTVVGPQGAPIQRAHATVFAAERLARGGNARDGVIELTLGPAATTTVYVSAPGYRTERLDDLTADRRVVLERGFAVLLRSSTRPALKDGDRTASLTLQPLDAPPPARPEHLPIHVPAALAARGEALVDFPGPGRYRLAVSVSQPASGGLVMASIARPLGGDEPILVEIREEDANGLVPVELPASLFE